MTSKLARWLAFTALLLGAAGANAAITCSISSSGWIGGYNPVAATIVQTSFTVSCTSSAVGDPSSVSYTVASNNGLNSLGINNRGFLSGASYIRYDDYIDGSCATQWKGATTLGGTINFAGVGTVTKTSTFWGCVAAGQTGLAAGTYTDSVTATMSYGPNPQSTATTTFPVTIITPATCSISTVPGNVAFGTYLDFGGALSASTGFGATCSNNLPYTLSVSPTGGTIAGIAYTLLLQNAAPVMSGTSLSVTGSGFQQSYTVNGSMAAGQSGTCAVGTCSAAVPHTLMLTY